VATLSLPAVFMSAQLRDAAGNPVPAWRAFWGIFGSSNQLLAGLTLLGLTVWLLRAGRRKAAWLTGFPMLFMLGMTLWSLARMVASWAGSGRLADPVGWVALVLSALAVLLLVEAAGALRRNPAPRPEAV